jgi:acylphosphatase
MSDALQRMEVRISGRVQGVGFRWWARSRAESLGLTGWVMNEDDERRVAIVAEGPPDRLDLFEQLLRDGPPSARVEEMDARREPASGTFSRFEITRP